MTGDKYFAPEPKSAQEGSTATARGIGSAIAHHGELIQGTFEDENGRLHRGLVTLPFARLRSNATFTRAGTSALRVWPQYKTKAQRAARLTLKHMGISRTGGDLVVESTVPIGHGYGSSTADVVASIRAVASAYDVKLRASSINCIAVTAEGASDAIAYEDQVVLFAQREGVVLEDFGGSLPPLLLVSFKADDGQPIDTLDLVPARYGSEEIQTFAVLRGLVARSIRFQDPVLLGRAATISSQIGQRHLPKARFDAVLELASRTGACGVQVAHSGSLIGVLLDATQRKALRKAEAIARTGNSIGFSDVELVRVHDGGATG